MKRLLACAAALALAACATPQARYLWAFDRAEAAGETFAPITEVVSEATLDDAYALQARIVATRLARGDAVAGYKGGLMSAASLAGRGVSEPLTGVLFASGALASGADVSLCGFRRAAFEMKVGYVFGAPVTAPAASAAELRALVTAVAPVVELPDIAYRDAASYGAVDMAAANISSARYVVGARARPDAADLDDLAVSMRRDGAAVTQGRGRESLGAQWESLRTVVNLVVARGGRIAAGDVVITGKIGDKGDVGPGAYVADYGPLGEVAFSAQACAD